MVASNPSPVSSTWDQARRQSCDMRRARLPSRRDGATST
jgi:hypothetical protein